MHEPMETDRPGTSDAGMAVPAQNGHKHHKRHKKHRSQPAVEEDEEDMVVDFEAQMKRRESINLFARQLNETVQKLQKGVDSDIALDDLVANIEQINTSHLITGKDITADGTMIHKAAQIFATKSAELRGNRRAKLSLDLLAIRLSNYGNFPSNSFAHVGRKFQTLLKHPPAFEFLRPCYALQEGNAFQVKKERARAKQQRNRDDLTELKGKTAKQAIEGEPDTNSVTKHLDNIRRCLRNTLKQRNSEKMSYYEFVLHPQHFGESVENMFHLSFLLKDGYVKLEVDNIGMPIISMVPKQERQIYQQNDRSKIETKQQVARFNFYIWKNLVEKLGIREPLITKPTE